MTPVTGAVGRSQAVVCRFTYRRGRNSVRRVRNPQDLIVNLRCEGGKKDCEGRPVEGPSPDPITDIPLTTLLMRATVWARGRILPLRSPFAVLVWDYINRAMPLDEEGTLTADEVYALTAYLLNINGVIPEDQTLDAQSLPKVKMPIGDNYAPLPDWKPRTPRLKGYPY
jgi:hypothetical protein